MDDEQMSPGTTQYAIRHNEFLIEHYRQLHSRLLSHILHYSFAHSTISENSLGKNSAGAESTGQAFVQSHRTPPILLCTYLSNGFAVQQPGKRSL